ncbi:MAG: (2Fe-2S) ferredoxin domain-containing protein [Alkaliphilus sp.]
MPKIKTFAELQEIRKNLENRLSLRKTAGSKDRIIVRVGMATCGIASGARQTMMAILDELQKEHIGNVVVSQTGCLGFCDSEPVVEVVIPDKPSILYGKVNEALGREIVTQHIMSGTLLDDIIISRSFETM